MNLRIPRFKIVAPVVGVAVVGVSFLGFSAINKYVYKMTTQTIKEAQARNGGSTSIKSLSDVNRLVKKMNDERDAKKLLDSKIQLESKL